MQVGPHVLAIWKPKHRGGVAFEMSARETPRRAGLGRAAHQARVCGGTGYRRRLPKFMSVHDLLTEPQALCGADTPVRVEANYCAHLSPQSKSSFRVSRGN